MKRIVYIMLSLICALPLHAAEVKNLKTGQTGDRGFATFDLAGKPGEKLADVTVFIEIGGERYPAEKLNLSGDFGKDVTVGVGKKIFWDVLKDMPAGFEGEAVWDLEASGSPVSLINTDKSEAGKPLRRAKARKANVSPLKDQSFEFEKNSFQFYRDLVLDTTTGLIWTRKGNIAEKWMGWNEAMEWVKTLDIGGFRDWRLPTKEELESLSKRGGSRPFEWLNSNGFNEVQSGTYWSSSTGPYWSPDTNGDAYYVNMINGASGSNVIFSSSFVWPVRSRR